MISLDILGEQLSVDGIVQWGVFCPWLCGEYGTGVFVQLFGRLSQVDAQHQVVHNRSAGDSCWVFVFDHGAQLAPKELNMGIACVFGKIQNQGFLR